MKYTLAMSSILFVTTTVLAIIDDDPPQLVVWAGTVQFVATILAVAFRSWWRRVTQ